jgi:hypothetical protein
MVIDFDKIFTNFIGNHTWDVYSLTAIFFNILFGVNYNLTFLTFEERHFKSEN